MSQWAPLLSWRGHRFATMGSAQSSYEILAKIDRTEGGLDHYIDKWVPPPALLGAAVGSSESLMRVLIHCTGFTGRHVISGLRLNYKRWNLFIIIGNNSIPI